MWAIPIEEAFTQLKYFSQNKIEAVKQFTDKISPRVETLISEKAAWLAAREAKEAETESLFEKANQTATALLNDIRKILLESPREFVDQERTPGKILFPVVLSYVLRSIAKDFPRNARDEEGYPMDPITLERIEASDLFITLDGYQWSMDAFNQLPNKSINPATRNPLTPQDQESMRLFNSKLKPIERLLKKNGLASPANIDQINIYLARHYHFTEQTINGIAMALEVLDKKGILDQQNLTFIAKTAGMAFRPPEMIAGCLVELEKAHILNDNNRDLLGILLNDQRGLGHLAHWLQLFKNHGVLNNQVFSSFVSGGIRGRDLMTASVKPLFHYLATYKLFTMNVLINILNKPRIAPILTSLATINIPIQPAFFGFLLKIDDKHLESIRCLNYEPALKALKEADLSDGTSTRDFINALCTHDRDFNRKLCSGIIQLQEHGLLINDRFTQLVANPEAITELISTGGSPKM